MRYIGLRVSFPVLSSVSLMQALLAVAVIFGIPFVVMLLLINPINQAGGLDAFIYTALIHDYGDVLERYGRTYYSTRIAFIYPARWAVFLFGSDAGYMIIRYTMLVVGSAAIFALTRRFYGIAIAIFGVITFCFSPWILKSLMWDHYDGFAAVYLLVGIYCLFAPRSRPWLFSAFAGAFYALAVNCNFFNLAIGVFLFPAWLVFYRREPKMEILLRLFGITTGFVTAYLGLALVVYFEFPQYGFTFEAVTIRMVRWMLEGGASNWFIPFAEFAERRTFFALASVFAIVAGFLYLLGNRFRVQDSKGGQFGIAMLIYLSLCVGLFLVMHFGFRSGLFSLHFYVTSLLPATTFTMIALVGTSCAALPRWYVWALLSFAAVFHLFVWFRFEDVLPYIKVAPVEVFAVLLLVPALLLSFGRVAAPLAATGAVALIVLVPFVFYPSAHYFGLHNRGMTALERDVYDGAIHLQRKIAHYVPPSKGPVGFWYGNGPEQTYLNSVQSTHLWGYSRLNSTTPGQPGMPTVDAAFKRALESRNYVVLLGMDSMEIDAGEEALEQAGIAFDEIVRDRFTGEVWGYQLAIVKPLPPVLPKQPELYPFPLSSLSVRNGAALTETDTGVLITGSPRPSNYSFVRQLVPQGGRLEGPAVLSVRIKMISGKFSVGVLKRGDSSNFISEIPVRVRGDTSHVIIPLNELSDVGDFVIREASPNGSSTAELYEIRVSRPDVQNP